MVEFTHRGTALRRGEGERLKSEKERYNEYQNRNDGPACRIPEVISDTFLHESKQYNAGDTSDNEDNYHHLYAIPNDAHCLFPPL